MFTDKFFNIFIYEFSCNRFVVVFGDDCSDEAEAFFVVIIDQRIWARKRFFKKGFFYLILSFWVRNFNLFIFLILYCS